MRVSACARAFSLTPSPCPTFIHLSSKAPWVIESCYIIFAVLVCFVAESWPVSPLSLSLSSSRSISTTHTLCSLLYSDDKACQSQTVLHHWCISNTRLFFFFLLQPSSPPGMKVTGGQTFHIEERRNSFIFRAVVHGYAYVLS